MTETIAKQIVKNKFWIVEESGEKIATIQAIDEGGVAYVRNDQREVFPSIKLLSKKYNIEFVKAEKPRAVEGKAYEIYGYPTPHRPYNVLFDVQRQLPIFTKTAKSKSFFCAGYYIVKFDSHWARGYCPKAITLNRYEYQGPFQTLETANQHLRTANGS
jgi:hypothetical protein